MATRPVREPISKAVKFWNIMIYGDPGVGKTVFAGQDNKALFMAPESDGLMSAATMNSTAENVKVKSWEDIKNTYEYWDENPEDLEDVNVLVIDSISEMQFLARKYALEVGAAEKVRKGRDPEKMELQDYGIMHECLENMVRGFNDLQVNVLWTATAKKVSDADENEFLVPDLQGKKDYGIAMKMAALMTSYGYLRTEIHQIPAPTAEDANAVKEVKRRVIYWEDTGTIRGKDRTNKLKPFTVNMTLQQMRLAVASKMIRAEDGRIVKVGVSTASPTKKATAPIRKAPEQASPQPKEKVDLVPQQDHSVAETAAATVEDKLTRNDSGEARGELELDAVEA